MAIFCPECGVQNEDNARFCSKCGKKFNFVNNPINIGTVSVPSAPPTEIPLIITENKPENISSDGNKPEGKKSGNKTVAIIIIVAVIIIAAVVVFFLVKGPLNTSEGIFGSSASDETVEETTEEPTTKYTENFVLYSDSNSLYYRLLDETTDSELADDLVNGDISMTVYNEEKNIFLYCNNFGNYYDIEGSSKTLYYVKLEPQKTPIKIDSAVIEYHVVNNCEYVVYRTSDNSLYKYDFENKTKIASNVYDLEINDSGDVFVYLTEIDNGDEGSTFNYYSVDENNNSTQIIDNADYPEYTSADYSVICFTKGNTVYRLTDGKNLNKIATVEAPEDDSDIKIISADENYVYYTTASTKKTVRDFITDNSYASDKAIKSPDKYDEKYWKTTGEDSRGTYAKTYTDEYYEEIAKYEEKQSRETFRNYLDFDLKLYLYTLWCSDGNKTDKITDSMQSYTLMANDEIRTPYFSIETLDFPEKTIDLKDVQMALSKNSEGYGDICERVKKMISESKSCSVVIDGKMNKFYTIDAYKTVDGEETYNDFGCLPNKIETNYSQSAIYYIDTFSYNGSGNLYKMEINGNSLGEAQQLYNNVMAYMFDTNDNVITYRNTVFNSDEYYSTSVLYVNDSRVAADVYGASDFEFNRVSVATEDDGTLIYITNYDRDSYTYTLYQYDGNESTTIGTDVFDWHFIDTDKILYTSGIETVPNVALGDGNLNIGTLYYYNDGTVTKFADDVMNIINPNDYPD